jgi:GWxTD domain-containing protein
VARRLSRTRLACVVGACAVTSGLCAIATPVRAASQLTIDTSRVVVRPLQPRWIPPESTRPQPLSLDWLEGDEWAFQVQSISTNDEFEEYSRLATPAQRDAFIARFWARRDPTQGTPANELRDEFMRRVQFALERFGASDRPGFGFDTDRGRMYLMLGSPESVDSEGAEDARFETWRYGSVAGLGTDVRIRFSLAREYCGFRIVSPPPARTVQGRTATVGIHSLGLVSISLPLNAKQVAGASYELRDGAGVLADRGQIGWIDATERREPLSAHLPPSWLADGFGCTHALPAGRYTLASTVRAVTGQRTTDVVTFEVE